MVDGGQDREHADAVADEVGRVARIHHALAQHCHQEGLQPLQDRRIGCLAGNQFGQVHVARRIEEVHAAEAGTQFLRQDVRQGIDAQARSVAGEDRVAGHVGGDLAVQVLLPVHALGDRLDHQVAIAQLLQPGLVVGRDDGSRQRLARQGCGAQLCQSRDRPGHDAVRVASLGRQVEQHGLDPGIGEVRGDLRAHDTRPEHRRLAYK